MLTINIITLFPPMFSGPFAQSIIKHAQDKNLVKINIHNLRDWAVDQRGTVDSRPYGGGKGMLLMAKPIFAAVDSIKNRITDNGLQMTTVLLTPQGKPFNQQKAEELAKLDHLILICGHYEGFDERIRQHLATDEISIGDYVLTGGELAAMVAIDAIARFVPGVLGATEGAYNDSYASGLLEGPQYTRPAVYKGWKVPDVVRSGNHAQIAQWKRETALERTLARRPDLLEEDA